MYFDRIDWYGILNFDLNLTDLDGSRAITVHPTLYSNSSDERL